MLQSTGSQRVRHDWATELNWWGQRAEPTFQGQGRGMSSLCAPRSSSQVNISHFLPITSFYKRSEFTTVDGQAPTAITTDTKPGVMVLTTELWVHTCPETIMISQWCMCVCVCVYACAHRNFTGILGSKQYLVRHKIRLRKHLSLQFLEWETFSKRTCPQISPIFINRENCSGN